MRLNFFAGVLGSALSASVILTQPIKAAVTTPVFVPETISSDVGSGYGLGIADVDGDGRLDILLADVWDYYWFRNGDWQRFLLTSRLDGQGAMSIDGRDVDGDGQVEIAVCTRGPNSSVYFLKRPDDPTTPWTPIKIPSEPELHRISWARDHTGTDYLVAKPIVGRRNHLREPGLPREHYEKARVYGYQFTLDPAVKLDRKLLVHSMHDMHTFAVLPSRPGGPEKLIFIGSEGLEFMGGSAEKPWTAQGAKLLPGMTPPNQRPDGSWHSGLGEIGEGHTKERSYLATVERKHGTDVVVYRANDAGEYGEHRQVLDDTLVTAHALKCVDLLGLGRDQIVAGWWGDGSDKNYGIRLYIPLDDSATRWQTVPIDEGTMSCQSLQIADIDGDGRLDVVAAGRFSNNIIIFWNRTEMANIQ